MEKNTATTILLVEDDPLLNKSIQKLLQREGFTTEGFMSGKNALERMSASSGDVLLLLDYTLPDMTGKEIIAAMRERGLDIPFVIITGHGDEQLAVEMMKLGALDYIVKSLQFHDVVPAKVRRACDEIAGRRKLVRAEEALKMAAAEWQKTFDSIADAVLILDQEQIITRCNRATLKLLGKPMEEVIGKNCCKAIHGSDGPIADCPVDKMKRSMNRESREVSLGDRCFNITADPIVDAGNVVIGAVHVISDITERKLAEEDKTKLEEQLRQSQKLEAIGQLAGGVAHDFNNLLGGIMGNAELIKMHSGKDPTIDRHSDTIVSSSVKAAELTRQLLTFARKARVNFTRLDINAAIINVIELLKHTIDRNIKIVQKIEPTPTLVQGDSNMIENALLNIAINARDAMPQGGTLSFATSKLILTPNTLPPGGEELKPGSYISVSITDTGTGMDKETQMRIFEPFFTTKEAGKGTGLGLAAVYGCVRQHNGYIKVESEIGVGTTFKLFLPEGSAVSLAEIASDTACVKGHGRILVVDDEQINGDTLGEILKTLGYTPEIFRDPLDALEYFGKNHKAVNAVVLDLIMPKMSGLDLFRAFKKLNSGVKVVVASGYSDNNQGKLIMQEGALEFVQKPYRVYELSKALARVLGGGK
jgi:two-component system cell cycle sensor histidine kinase/response regulator CckA